MTAGYQDQFLEQGTTFNTTLYLDDNNSVPYNLSGFSVNAQARRSYRSNNIVITFNTEVIDANNGVVSLSANTIQTSNIKSRKLVYDVIITENNTGFVTRILEGQIHVSYSVTR